MTAGLKRNLWKVNGCVGVACFAISMTFQVYASNCTVNPVVPSPGRLVTVTYDPAGGPLDNAGTVYIHRGINGWAQTEDQPMSRSKGVWTLAYSCPEMAVRLDYVFHNGSGTWDNNNGADWHVTVSAPDAVGPPPPLPAHASKAGVMMQGFYWDCPSGWYKTMAEKAGELRNMQDGWGIDRLWFPPPQKSESGGYSMGYDPYDYFDVGQYHQKGTTATHFGTQAELKAAIEAYRAQGIVCMADIVLNHRLGGDAESNPNLGGASTWTDFSGVASGECLWNYNQFHPSSYEVSDDGPFKDFPDICHVTGTSKGDAAPDLVRWGNWLMDPANAGFDGGWRFDYVKGIHPSFLANFRTETGQAFGIIEFWDKSIDLVDSYVKQSGSTSAFDFPAFYTMVDVFNQGEDISQLVDPSRVYAAKNPDQAVTFVANHDTDKDAHVESVTRNTMLAYAFILTYEGYPCIFWKDYFDRGMATLGGQVGNGIKPLVWVRGALGGGQPDIELLSTARKDLLVYGTLNGSSNAPGYIVVINNHADATQTTRVRTDNSFLHGKTLQCHAWYSYAPDQNKQPADVSCGADGGNVIVRAPPRGYAVYSVARGKRSEAEKGVGDGHH